MNTSSDPSKETKTIHVHIVQVVEEKGRGYTVVIEVPSDADFTSEEVWRLALPGDYRGATKIHRLWHLYYVSDPGYLPGWLDISLPAQAAKKG
jgi:hypothetical protein